MLGKNYWFISHCSKDIQVVDQIVDILKACNIPYWKAPEMIPSGSNYAREIPNALKNCGIFLFVVSEASQSSIWVEKEVDIAINIRKKIIPVKIDAVPLNDMYRFYLNNIQTIDIPVQPDGQIPKDVQKKLQTMFMEHAPQAAVTQNTLQRRTETIDLNPAKVDTRSNAFRMNKIPMQCERCGTQLEGMGQGVYRCVKCNIEYYDDFRKIRNFIEENGPAPARIISRETGVSLQSVDYYFKDAPSGMRNFSNLAMMQKSNKGGWHSGRR